MKQSKINMISSIILFLALLNLSACEESESINGNDPVDEILEISGYPVVGTGQNSFYDGSTKITEPSSGEAFYGQDAHYNGNTPVYKKNADGTVSDLVTGLMWQQSPDLDNNGNIDVNDKLTYSEALAGAGRFDLAGYTDWRLPTIKELYSLIMFSGLDPSGFNNTTDEGLVPFINTSYFAFGYGDTGAGERMIDAQFATSTLYTSTTMGDNETMFGVNFADGRIKGYPTGPMPGQSKGKLYYVLYVRGNPEYGVNNYTDNGDGTITDNATGLMWMQSDSKFPMNWEEALAWAENAEFAGYTDWRLPDAKELQSIVDYTRSPEATATAAIDPVFSCTQIINEGGETDYPCYWSSSTHANMSMNPGANAAYLCFGKAIGYFHNQWMDVHGAGAQRSDPKEGNADMYPYGHGPQGDAIRIDNYVRLVRKVNLK